MFIRKTTKKVKSKVYENYLLVESYATANGPRQRTICSLGTLKPAPVGEWLSLAKKIETALSGQITIEEKKDKRVEDIVDRIRSSKKYKKIGNDLRKEEIIPVIADKVATENHKEAGTVHAGIKFWNKLGIDSILKEAGLSERARILTLAMTMNRLISPLSEYAMPNWINRTALGDILEIDFSTLSEDSLYRNLDKIHKKRTFVEKRLWEKEKTLFNLDSTIYLYDCTSTYFEGQCPLNKQAKRGYSRDGRPDCKQVIVGLVVNKDGFPIAHEIFEGNRPDTTTVEEMLTALEKRCGRKEGTTVVVDRGMSSDNNLATIKAHGYHYIVASRRNEHNLWLKEFACNDDWKEIKRGTSPTNRYQKKSVIKLKSEKDEDFLYVLCRSADRQNKDRAIREKQEIRFLNDLKKLSSRIKHSRIKAEVKINEAIGRLKERYSRAARHYEIKYNPQEGKLLWDEHERRRETAKELDGCYILKTDRIDMSQEEVWLVYSLLTRAESAFRSMKSPLAERPIFHQLTCRVQTHIFLCVMAYHLLVAMEKTLLEKGIHTSWSSVRECLSTHQVCTVVLPTPCGDVLRIRKGGTPESQHLELYKALDIPSKIMKPIRTWFYSEST